MAKKQTSKKTSSNTPIELLVAKYGLIGTIAAAAIAFLGVVVVAYFSYLGIQTQIESPIKATLTAEARIASLAPATQLPPSPSLPTETPTDISSSTRVPQIINTATDVVASPTLLPPSSTPTAPPSPTPNPELAIIELINLEAKCTLREDPKCIELIYMQEATLRDAAGQSFNGRDAILGRYNQVFRDLDFISLNHINIQPRVLGNSATAGACTVQSWMQNNKTTSPPIQKESWQFELTLEGWRVNSFTYNLGPCN